MSSPTIPKVSMIPNEITDRSAVSESGWEGCYMAIAYFPQFLDIPI